MRKLKVLTILIALISSQAWAQGVNITLIDGEITITRQEFDQLTQASETIQEMLADVPEELKSLYLPGIDRTTFDLLIQVQDKTGDALHNELKSLSDEQVHHLMTTANYLAAKELLDATALIVAGTYFRDKHINQLLTEDGYKNYYENLELIPNLQTKIAQQFTKLPLFLLLKKWTKQAIYEFEHKGDVYSVAFDHTGNYLATGSLDEKARIFDWKIKEQLQQFEHGDWVWVRSVAFDPTGRYLATGGSDSKARIFNLKTGEQQQFEHEGTVNSVAFDPKGRYLATGSSDSKARIFDLTTRKLKQQFKHEGTVRSVAFDPKGRYLATGSEDKNASIFNLATGEQQQFEHESWVWSVAFDPIGKYLATGSYDKKARIFDLKTKEQLKQFEHVDNVLSVAFDPTGNYLATGSSDKKARIFDLKTKEQLQQFEHGEDWVWSVAFDPTGNYLATGSAFMNQDNRARIFIFLPALEKALQKLTLNQTQVIALVAKKKINPSLLPNHLKEIYADLPEVVRLLLEKKVGQ